MHHQHDAQEAEVGGGQRRQVAARTTHLQVAAQEHHAREQVANEADADDHRNVVSVEEAQVREEGAAVVAVGERGVDELAGQVAGELQEVAHRARRRDAH